MSRNGSKLTDYAGTVGYLAQTGDPMPSVTAFVAVVVEVIVALAPALWTRPLALYTHRLIGHPFWSGTMEGAARYASVINFYKNISIRGGFLLLYVTGAGNSCPRSTQRFEARRLKAAPRHD